MRILGNRSLTIEKIMQTKKNNKKNKIYTEKQKANKNKKAIATIDGAINGPALELPIIQFKKVKKVFSDGFIALNDLNLEIKEGEFITIVGRSGAGKTTLVKLIYAEKCATEGEAYFKGRAISEIKKKILPHFRRNFGLVFQDYKLLQKKTVFENVAYALEVVGEKTKNINEEVAEILDMVGLVNEADKYPYQLSGGEKQKTSLARALINRPHVIIADEPTGNLDPISSWEIVELLLKINKLGTTVILATHDRDVVDRVGQRVVVLDGGKIVSDKKKGKYLL